VGYQLFASFVVVTSWLAVEHNNEHHNISFLGDNQVNFLLPQNCQVNISLV
jgi:hypothetical protein